MLWLDPDNDAGLFVPQFGGKNITVEMLLQSTRVALSQSIGVFFRPIGCHRDDAAANRDPPRRIRRIDDKQADAGIALHVPALLALECRVDQDMLTVAVHPDDCRMGLAVGEYR